LQRDSISLFQKLLRNVFECRPPAGGGTDPYDVTYATTVERSGQLKNKNVSFYPINPNHPINHGSDNIRYDVTYATTVVVTEKITERLLFLSY
jgi:hypothetical protein